MSTSGSTKKPLNQRAHFKSKPRSRSRSQSRRGSRKPRPPSPKLAAKFYVRHKAEMAGLNPQDLARKRFQRAILSIRAIVRFTLGFRTAKKKETDLTNCKLENTYLLEPLPGQAFAPNKVSPLMEALLEEHLSGYQYDRSSAPKLARALSSVISDKMKELNFPRYKYICNVILAQNSRQGFDFSSRGLWNANTDAYSCASYKKENVFAVATVHAVYFE